jgi:hypothetical protein
MGNDHRFPGVFFTEWQSYLELRSWSEEKAMVSRLPQERLSILVFFALYGEKKSFSVQKFEQTVSTIVILTQGTEKTRILYHSWQIQVLPPFGYCWRTLRNSPMEVRCVVSSTNAGFRLTVRVGPLSQAKRREQWRVAAVRVWCAETVVCPRAGQV